MLNFTEASLADAELIHQIVKAAFSVYVGVLAVTPSGVTETLDEVRQDLTRATALLAWDDDKAIATARYYLEPDYFYIGKVAVLPEYKGKGVGSELMQYLEKIAIQLGQTEMHLSTRQSMPANLSFYQKLGYKVSQIEPHPRGADFIVSFVKVLDK